jgi:hypothetical protein
LGSLTYAAGASTVAIGYNASSTSLAVAIGRNANASASSAVVIGNNAVGSSTSAVAIGITSIASNLNSVAIGSSANSSSRSGIALGASSKAMGGNFAAALGQQSWANATSSFSIGSLAYTDNTSAYAIGTSASSNSTYSYAIGASAGVVRGITNGYAVGQNATDSLSNTINFSTVDIVTPKNFSGNQYYGELWNGSESNGQLYTISTEWMDLNNTFNGSRNGFGVVYNNSGVYLNVSYGGLYHATWSATVNATTATIVIDFVIRVNDTYSWNNTRGHATVSVANNAANAAGTGFIRLLPGQNVSLSMRAYGGTPTIELQNANINLVRVGD